ncbi:hypothetical protein Hypma_003134 [Hypsizygus marmoreus]|uniref:BTB domain-containing protein n=1 Tax=Hypsizygus marmoreus TaxID=39966 RepID=A0A369J4A6_HYPMA|nr:hypothetical protein Hypma_003134 [Hypsizygus marmoreus]
MSSETTVSPQVEPKIPLCRENVCNDCTRETDVIFESIDHIRYGGHVRLFENYGGFRPAGMEGERLDVEIVQMPYHSPVLRLLLAFMHHDQPQPSVASVDIYTLRAFADAAQKHEIFPAIQVCKLQMEIHIPNHPLIVFSYAARYKYRDLLNKAAKFTIDSDFSVLEKQFGSDNSRDALYAWFRYREGWLELQKASRREPRFIQHKKNSYCEPSAWVAFHAEVLKAFGESLSTLAEATNIVARYEHMLNGCDKCLARSGLLKTTLDNQLDRIKYASCSLFLV